MEPMPHGYTNRSVTDGHLVVKSFVGPDPAARQAREELALRRLAGIPPVPELISSVPGTLTTTLAKGVPAQEAIDAGAADRVLHACGRLLADVQSVDPRRVFGSVDHGSVLVHNDFGPNNVVMDPEVTNARLLCDWEWVMPGDRTSCTDLAWAEFIVRYHHPESVPALAALFDGYGDKPTWAHRHAAMTARATAHRDFLRSWQQLQAAATWDQRLATIAAWHETR